MTAINNTGLTVTLAAALPGGDAGAGTALTKLENPTMKVGALAAVGITTINAAGTSIVVTATQATGGPGTAIKFGVERESTWYAVWVTNESGTIGTRLSTQRTTPYSTAAAKRRVGWVRNDVSGNVMEFSFLGIGLSRRMHFEVEAGRAALRVVSNGTGATDTWVKYSFADAVPPTSSIVWAFVGRSGGVNMSLYTRPAGFGLSTVSRNTLMQLQVDNHGFPVGLFCDLAQQIEFTQTGGTTGVYVDVAGYEDDLTR